MPWDSRRTLYLVTPPARANGRDVLDVVARVLAAEPERVAVQLRDRDANARELLEQAKRLATLCRACRVPFMVSDRVDVALAAEADGVHLPAAGMKPADARVLLPSRLIGASCHGAPEVAQREGADFLVLGPVFETPSKKPFGPPIGLGTLAEGVRRATRPVIAIGGINSRNAGAVAKTGCAGIACISDVFDAADPAGAAAALIRAFESGRPA